MPAPERPLIFVLAGVNGAGKSSVGGSVLAEHGLTWFNPDAFSRQLIASGWSKEDADGAAWAYGRAQLEAAIANASAFAFETTLGGDTMTELLRKAADTHDILMLFCGLASVEQHIDRVRSRVCRGGHDIPEEKIRQRWVSSRRNLIGLLPRLAHLQVFDNSAEVAPGEDVPDPVLVLETRSGRITYPGRDNVAALTATPDWAKPIVEAALRYDEV
jgi:predicted ABC-type ATPase